ncbi:MAG: DUF1508 domain-containing protein [Treponema sp.]|jgi:uncharacterized protein YegP (UPF0339 family)|nr:DUF1508 domain-containing protein [Treponema sp.]
MASKFEIFLDRKKQYRFHLKATNGEIIAVTSEGYETRTACMKGIASIQRNAPKAAIVDLTITKKPEASLKAPKKSKTPEAPKDGGIAKPRSRKPKGI